MPFNAFEKYPATPHWAKVYIVAYPVIIMLMTALPSSLRWLWIVAAFFGLAWIGSLSVFLSTMFRRDGYQAALDDLASGSPVIGEQDSN